MKIFNDLGIKVNPKTIMSTMPVSQRQMVEIAKAVSYGAKVIVFDEPTSSLTEQEVEHLFKIINMLRDRGCGIVYISHKMEEILRISDEVTIMRDGQWVATRPAREVTMNEIIRLMVGRELTNRFPPKEHTVSDSVGTHSGGPYGDVLRAYGRILRASQGRDTGHRGAGRLRPHGAVGNHLRQSRPASTASFPKTACASITAARRNPIANGLAMVTEERRATGHFQHFRRAQQHRDLVPEKVPRRPVCAPEQPQDAAKKRSGRSTACASKTPSLATKIRSLSGGNQQKVIIGRWLLTEPEIFLMDEPTRGIDVGAKYEIYQIIIDMAREGKSVVMVSSEMPELLGVCDRILVMSGRQARGRGERGRHHPGRDYDPCGQVRVRRRRKHEPTQKRQTLAAHLGL